MSIRPSYKYSFLNGGILKPQNLTRPPLARQEDKYILRQPNATAQAILNGKKTIDEGKDSEPIKLSDILRENGQTQLALTGWNQKKGADIAYIDTKKPNKLLATLNFQSCFGYKIFYEKNGRVEFAALAHVFPDNNPANLLEAIQEKVGQGFNVRIIPVQPRPILGMVKISSPKKLDALSEEIKKIAPDQIEISEVQYGTCASVMLTQNGQGISPSRVIP